MPEPIIVDTDPGVDDVLALIFLLLSPEVHIRAITLTHGNTSLTHIKRNAVTLLHVMQKHRELAGLTVPLEELPVLAVGSELPLNSKSIFATYFHNTDGLGGIYDAGKYAAPADWEDQILHKAAEDADPCHHRAFRTTERDAADEILYQLKQAPPLTVSILAVGPLTNVALAYQRDPVTLSRAKRIVIMGGAVDCPGNVTPMAEFNFRADPDAADIVLGASKGFRHTPEGYRERVELVAQGKQAPSHVVVLPLKGAEDGNIYRKDYERHVVPLKNPLGVFCNAFLEWTFDVCKRLFDSDSLSVYDAFTGLLLLDLIPDKGDGCPAETTTTKSTLDKHWEYQYCDLRVETSGQYTLGMSCYDKRAWHQDKPSWNDAPNHVQVITRGDGARFNRMILNRVFDAGIKESSGEQ
ncbi:Inosine/uridine-preferring nucleoside hydrolase domain-containing protein [Zychaea mexicana]|uniref:Inosine/uridine-preferring nucleoside hydrolase domain-containing protein n=1 Tax=Zychaea mexicana TaxID=64656 RepID=UPI0022FE756B|nr:Inosine/uridine-preferring nucleoside hydrolase domain-containing protein [Zychaea mexicana]KAI9494385.1 Inosine/uridine-preferring nucleoside hydrolase domain-containing protein [Zychaea mexicana]